MSDLLLQANDKQYGPFSSRELRLLANKGRLTPSDQVWSDEDGAWVRASELVELRQLFEGSGAKANGQTRRIFAIGGGKGGVGKTVLTASIGVALASLKKKVVMVDADLGGANLHTVMGILEPERTFFDFYSMNVDGIEDIVLPTHIKGLQLISGACGTLGLANPKYQQKLRFIRQLRSIDSDFILLDLGAGTSYNVIDFFLIADEGVVITNPEPMAVQECFNFLKICLLRRLRLAFRNDPNVMSVLELDDLNKPGRINITMSQVIAKVRELDGYAAGLMEAILESYRPRLILNMVMEKDDIKEGLALQSAASELLSIDLDYLGFISYDQDVRSAVRDLKPFLLENPNSVAAQDLAKLVSVKLLGQESFIKNFFERRKLKKNLMEQRSMYPEVNLQEQAPICSIRCFYWGECEYQNGGHPCSVRHLEPIFKS